MALKRVSFATAHNASQFASARWNFQPVPDGFGNAPIQLVEIPPGNPRFAYNPATGEPEGLLIEEQRTNLLTYSEQFDDASWGVFDVTVTANAISAPDGALAADKLIEINTTEVHQVAKVPTLSPSTDYVVSIYVKAAERNWFRISTTLGSGVLATAFFDVQNGVIGTTSNCIAKIKNVGNGWYRCQQVFTNDTGAATNTVRFGLATADNIISYLGDGTSGIYIWGAQLEVGSFSTSYIPTAGTAVTRTADIVARTLGAEFNPNEGTFVVEWNAPFIALNSRVIGTNRSNTSIYIASSDRLAFDLRDLGDPIFISTLAVASGKNKLAVKFNSSSVSFSLNGSGLQSAATSSNPFADITTILLLGRDLTGSTNIANATTSKFNYEPRAVSDTELQELSRL